MAAAILPIIATQIGHPCPPAEGHSAHHSVTMHVPTWQSALDFIDGKPEIFQTIRTGYPRIAIHQDIKALVLRVKAALHLDDRSHCFLFPSALSAEAARQFAATKGRTLTNLSFPPDAVAMRTLAVGPYLLYAVVFPIEATPAVMRFWAHSGLGISSRFAHSCLQQTDAVHETQITTSRPLPEGPEHQSLKERITRILEAFPRNADAPRAALRPDDVFLHQTGMATIHETGRCLADVNAGTTIRYAFGYHHTSMALEDFGACYKFFGRATMLQELEDFIRDEVSHSRPIESLWAEFPSNPTLETADVSALRSLADQFHFVLVIDDTVAGFCNVDMLGQDGADLLVSSLTKSFSGHADVIAGSVVLNPSSRWYSELRAWFDKFHANEFFVEDARILEVNSRDYLPRSVLLNRSASTVADYLHQASQLPGSMIAGVYYPSLMSTKTNYDQYMRGSIVDGVKPGYGYLLTVELKDEAATIAFYDSIGEHVHIGPHIGAHVTLAFVYTKIFFSKDLATIAPWGLNDRQVRVSIGHEETATLIAIFKKAIDAATVLTA